MSKSEGNVLDPVDLIDGIALARCWTSAPPACAGRDRAQVRKNTEKEFPDGIPAYSAPTRCASPLPRWPAWAATSTSTASAAKGYRNFCNKLWNATRFVLMNCEGQTAGLKKTTGKNARRRAVSTAWCSARPTAGSPSILQTEAEMARALPNTAGQRRQRHDFVWNGVLRLVPGDRQVQIQTGSESQQRPPAAPSSARWRPSCGWRIPGDPVHHRRTLAKVSVVGPAERVGPAHCSATPKRSRRNRRAPSPMVTKLPGSDACRNLRGNERVARHPSRCMCWAWDFMQRNASGVAASLAKLSEVRLFDDEASWSPLPRRPRWPWSGDARLPAHGNGRRRRKARWPGKAARLEGFEIAKATAKLGQRNAFVARRLRRD